MNDDLNKKKAEIVNKVREFETKECTFKPKTNEG